MMAKSIPPQQFFIELDEMIKPPARSRKSFEDCHRLLSETVIAATTLTQFTTFCLSVSSSEGCL